MTPVIVLTDGYIANGAEPWRVPGVEELPEIPVRFRTDPAGFRPYERLPDTLARPWVVPGTPGLEHRVGGLEKQDGTGNISYDPRTTSPWSGCARRRWKPWCRTCRTSILAATRRGPADGRLGRHPRRHQRRAARGAREAAGASVTCTCGT